MRPDSQSDAPMTWEPYSEAFLDRVDYGYQYDGGLFRAEVTSSIDGKWFPTAYVPGRSASGPLFETADEAKAWTREWLLEHACELREACALAIGKMSELEENQP